MKIVFRAAVLAAFTEGIVWLDLLIHPVGQGAMATPSPVFLWPHLPAIALLEPWSYPYPAWLRMTLFLLVSWGAWFVVWATLLFVWRSCCDKSRTMRSSEPPSAGDVDD